jgi:hypothetical protein
VCGGAGVVSLVTQAAALVAAASEPVGTCDGCGEILDDDARMDEALQTLCGACIDADRAEAVAARQAAISAAHAQYVAERATLAA